MPSIRTQKNQVEKRIPRKKLNSTSFVEAELAVLVEAPPSGDQWVHETKFDGYRMQAHVQNGQVKLFNRNAQNWTRRFPTVEQALHKLKKLNVILDGEIVWMDEEGRSDFQKLQNALQDKKSDSILYYVFDLLFFNGEDWRQKPLLERKAKLEEILLPLRATPVLFSDHIRGEAEEFLEAACDLQLEGIISKRADSAYLSGRNENWLKSKCKLRQEFVIGGFTRSQGASSAFGSLLLGVYDQGQLHYVGKVGTGFSLPSLLDLEEKINPLISQKKPFKGPVPEFDRETFWVRPELVAEVTFANWTHDGILRIPVFQGLREDKAAREISLETPRRWAKASTKSRESK